LPDNGRLATPDPSAHSGEPGDAWAVRTSRGVARGDRDALAALYSAWFDRCQAAARAATGRDESFCLDVVQDAMVKAASSLRPVRSQAELAAWMQRVVTSCALDRLRAESARARRERSSSPATPPPHDPHELAGRIAWLEVQLAAAAPLDRDLLRHRFIAGATLDQAGAAAGMSGPAAHGRIRRLIDALRRAGKEHPNDQ